MGVFALIFSIFFNFVADNKVSIQNVPIPSQTNIPNPKDSLKIPVQVLEYLETHAPDNCALKLESQQHSLTGRHLRFIQLHQGYSVNDARLDIHTNQQGEITIVQNQLIYETFDILEIPNKTLFNPKLTWVKFHGGWVLAEWKLMDATLGLHHLMFQNEIVDQKNTKLFHHLPDSFVSAKVFLINPLQTAQRLYGTPYIDSSDLDVPQINAERKWVKMKAEFVNDTFWLRSKRYWFTEISDPVTPVTFSVTGTFDFLRSTPQFEDVNAFYHITTFSDYIENLGFEAVLPDTLVIDAHGYNGAEVSSFNFGIFPVELEFGEGGVDDAEDGEVVVHEFGHCLSYMAAPNTDKGVERLTMEEGNADYFTTSYGRSYSDFGWREIFDWDGHNPFFSGVLTGVKKTYPNDLTRNSNDDRELWSSPLMCIYEKLGRATSDSLVLEHLFYQTQQSKMPEMAEIMLKIDTMLWQGKHYYTIKSCFVDFGILHWGKDGIEDSERNGGLSVVNSSGFAIGSGNLLIKSNSAGEIKVTANDMLGREVGRWTSNEIINISPVEFQSGIYQLRIHQNDVHLSYKIIKN